jgi:hypothetical protein
MHYRKRLAHNVHVVLFCARSDCGKAQENPSTFQDMTSPKGVRLRDDQAVKAAKFCDKTTYDYADYIRAAVDFFQQQPKAAQEAQVRTTRSIRRGSASDK